MQIGGIGRFSGLLATSFAVAALLPALAAAGSISGSVTDASTDAGIAGVEVCAHVAPLELERFCAESEDGGEYVIEGLDPDQYEVEFQGRSQGYVTQYYAGRTFRSEADPISVGATAVTGIDAALTLGGTIEGTVTEKATGAPFAGLWVCAVDTLRRGFGGCTHPDSNGEYAIKGLPEAEYHVQFLPPESGSLLMVYYRQAFFEMFAESVAVSAGGVQAGVDAEIERAAEIEGTVRAAADGAPIAGARICAWEAGIGSTGQCAESAADGTYLIEGLRPVEHKVEFWARGMVEQAWNNKPGWNEADVLLVPSEGKLTGIDAYLVPEPAPAVVPPLGPTPPVLSPSPRHVIPKRCRKGFKKKKVKGKVRCVRKHKHHPRRRGPSGS